MPVRLIGGMLRYVPSTGFGKIPEDPAAPKYKTRLIGGMLRTVPEDVANQIGLGQSSYAAPTHSQRLSPPTRPEGGYQHRMIGGMLRTVPAELGAQLDTQQILNGSNANPPQNLYDELKGGPGLIQQWLNPKSEMLSGPTRTPTVPQIKPPSTPLPTEYNPWANYQAPNLSVFGPPSTPQAKPATQEISIPRQPGDARSSPLSPLNSPQAIRQQLGLTGPLGPEPDPNHYDPIKSMIQQGLMGHGITNIGLTGPAAASKVQTPNTDALRARFQATQPNYYSSSPVPNPDNRLTDRQALDQARGNQYAPMGLPPLATAPATQEGFNAQMQAQNPGGRLFGGALPAMGTSPSGAQRPMFLSGPAVAGSTGKFDTRRADAEALRRGVLTPASASQELETTAARKMLGSQARQDYLAGRRKVLDERRAGVQAKSALRAADRAEAVRLKRGHLSFEERLGMAEPGAYAALQAARGQQALAGSQMEMANAMRGQELGLRGEAIRAQERIAADKTAAAERMNNVRAGLPAGGAPAPSTSPLEAPAPSALSGLTPAERQEAVKNLPKATQDRLLSQADRKGFLSRLFLGGLNQPGQAPITDAMHPINNPLDAAIYPLERAVAATINTPELVYPSAKARRTPEQLQERPGMNAAQKAAAARLRAARGLK